MNIWHQAVRLLRLTARAAGRAYYHACRTLPLDANLAVFASYWYRGYSCNPAAIYEEVRELAPSVRGVWIVDRRHRSRVPAGVPVVVAGSLAYYRALARATWLVNNVNFPGFVVKRRGSIHVQTHHGTPVKVMGVEQARFPATQRTDLTAVVRGCARWDYSITSNAHSTKVWKRSYPGRYKTLEYGYPRNDRLALAGPAEYAASRARLRIEPGTTVVLYAPTHRDHRAGFRPLFDTEEFADALGSDHLVLVRSHYLYAPSGESTHPRVGDVSAHPSIEELFLATVSRLPTSDEREACLKFMQSAESPEKGLQGVLWGLLNTREFLLQH